MKRALFCFLAGASGLFAAESAPLTPEAILKKVTLPPEFAATVFASPPNIAYPIFLSAAADGTLFVSCDENGSLDRQPGRGRVVRLRDTDGDGRADEFITVAKMDSPRGVAWDAATRTLYVMHPPNLTAYHCDAATGVSTSQEDLITNLGFGLDFRGADHTTNGIRLGIDGWIYVAVGDYGAVKATGRDGRTLAMRGGGIVRVRPDGTGLELYVRGTRNILAVAISPTLDLFARDNTNDGDDWNDRLSFMPPGAHMGYPTLFRNFSDEIIPTMIDFGGGSPIGSIFIDEPALPRAWSYGLFTAEWGRNEISLHPLTPAGAAWKAETKQFMKMPRATDLDVDGAARLYASSWDGAQFTYVGPNVGFILRLVAKDAKPTAVPDFTKLSATELVDHIGGASGVERFAAQRELLKRGEQPGVADALRTIVARSDNAGARVAAIFTLKLLLGEKSHAMLSSFLGDTRVRETILKALADDPRVAADVPAKPFVDALADTDARVRLQAVYGLARLGKSESASALVRRTADADPTVSHVAIAALGTLRASEACFAALDGADKTLHAGALRVLQSLHEPAVADGLIKRLASADPELRRGLFAALARLDTKEAAYTDPKMWWGTRPDTSGPLFKPERWESSDAIEAALKRTLDAAEGGDAQLMVTALLRAKVSFPGFSEMMLAKAGRDAASRLDVITPLVSPKAPAPVALLDAVKTIATTPTETVDARVRAARLLVSLYDKNTDPVTEAFAALSAAELPAPLAAVWNEFVRDSRHARRASTFIDYLHDTDPGKRRLGAAVVVNLVANPLGGRGARGGGGGGKRGNTRLTLDGQWDQPLVAAALLRAIGDAGAKQFAPQIRERLTNENPAVAAAAKAAFAQLHLGEADAGAKKISELPFADVVAQASAPGGDAKRGQELFTQRACIVCHTISPNDPPKGPMLGGVAQRYSRAELCESILKPSAKIAQGFESQAFTLRKGPVVEGFIVREGGDSVEVRNIAGVTTVIEKGDIVSREHREKSIMPEGLVADLTTADLASLLAFLESTSEK